MLAPVNELVDKCSAETPLMLSAGSLQLPVSSTTSDLDSSGLDRMPTHEFWHSRAFASH